MNLSPEQQFEVNASVLDRDQLYKLAKKQALTLQVVVQMRKAQMELRDKHNEDSLREVTRLQTAVDFRLSELGIKAI